MLWIIKLIFDFIINSFMMPANDFWSGFWPNFWSSIISGVVIGIIFSLIIAKRIGKEISLNERKYQRLLQERIKTERANDFYTGLLQENRINESRLNFVKEIFITDFWVYDREFEIRNDFWNAFNIGDNLYHFLTIKEIIQFSEYYKQLETLKQNMREFLDYRTNAMLGRVNKEEIKERAQLMQMIVSGTLLFNQQLKVRIEDSLNENSIKMKKISLEIKEFGD